MSGDEIMNKDLYSKFPYVLKNKLMNNEIKFPSSTEFDYEPLRVYRAVSRKCDDNSGVSLNDFKSYFELKKKPRGVTRNLEGDATYYGVSSFLDKKIVKQLMNFPNPNKKLAEGYVFSEGGPQCTDDKHVCWWLYDGVDVSEFKIVEEDNDNG